MHERGVQGRIWFVAATLFLAFVVLGGKLAYLHLSNHSKVTGHAYRQKLLGLRGGIFDCNGRQSQMTVSLPGWQYHLDPNSVKKDDIPHVAATVSTQLDIPRDEVLEKLQRTGTSCVGLGTKGVTLDSNVFKVLSGSDISGVGFNKCAVRHYPQGNRMSHVLGYVNTMGVGSAGVEQRYNRYLTGTAGLIEGEKDAGRREIFTRRKVYLPPIKGADVFLTLDHNIQYEVERVLKETVEMHDALSGWVIVQRVKTGEILAMASFPDYEPKTYSKSTLNVLRNNAIAVVYEPGSVMKAVTVAAALNRRLITRDEMFDVGEGVWFYAGKPLRDHVFGKISLSTVLKKSSNIACAQLGVKMGSQVMEGYLRAFNFGAPLGIDLPGEEKGILLHGEDWKRDRLKIARVPIGQGVAVTGLQMINAFSTLGNGGKMMKPYVVSKVVSSSGELLYEAKPELMGRPVRPEVARAVCEMLIGVTEKGGTAERAAVPGFTVAGKTGTAQKAVPGGYSNTDFYSTFVGVVPARDPGFSVLVTVDRPRPARAGGFVAGPAFAKIAAATAHYLGVEPDKLADDERQVAGR